MSADLPTIDPASASGPRMAAPTRSRRLRKLWGKIDAFVYPILALTLLVLAWHYAIEIFDVKKFILPKPKAVLDTLIDDWPVIQREMWPTIKEIVFGYLMAIAVGIPLAVGIVASRVFEKMFYPLLVISQTVPKIAIAPLLLVWFGFGTTPKILIAFAIAFFPIVIDTVVGLRSVPEEMIDLARAMGGNAVSVFRKVRFPYALPNIFGGLKVAITLATIGAIVGEFVGSSEGLGHLLLIASGRLDTTLLFATIIVLSLLGIVFFLAVDLAERLTIPWHTSQRQGGGGTGTFEVLSVEELQLESEV